MDLSRCEACRQAEAECTVASGLPHLPYRLCPDCRHRLETWSLRPLEWFHLAAIHGPGEHLLDDEAYWFGQAILVDEEIPDAELYPVPQLEEVQDDLDRLIEYAVAHFEDDMAPPVVQAFGRYSPERVIGALEHRLEVYPSPILEKRALQIAARALGLAAAGWLRSRWAQPDLEQFGEWAKAAASCLPRDEGYARVMEALAQLPPQELSKQFMALQPFAGPDVLDWIETHVTRPVVRGWGRLAAESEIDWPRAEKWLELGRPLSLVALDALFQCDLTEDTEEAEAEEVVDALLRYLARDPVPRVRKTVVAIMESWKGSPAFAGGNRS